MDESFFLVGMKYYLKYLALFIILLLKALKPSQGQYERRVFEYPFEIWTLPPVLERLRPGYSPMTCPFELLQCHRIIAFKSPICAISTDHQNVEIGRKNFSTICDMQYANCKLNEQHWHYLKDYDGKC